MRIKPDIKLDYKDVLLEPKRSDLTSRKDVAMEREFTFLHSQKTFNGIPIMASNMDGVGTFEMAKVLQEYRMVTVMRKHYTVSDWENAVGQGIKLKYVSVCTGTGRIWSEEAQDYSIMKQVINNFLIFLLLQLMLQMDIIKILLTLLKKLEMSFQIKQLLLAM